MLELQSSLDALLDKHSIDDGTLDFHGVHGFLTAMTICPLEVGQKEVFAAIFDGDVTVPEADSERLDQYLALILTDIDRGFNDEDEGFTLSCEGELDTHDDDSLTNWCIGFMVAHFMDEDRWFIRDEQEVCELLLPIMLASGLFDDEEEFKEIRKDSKLTEDMCSQIPEVLMELYLMFNSPEEKKPAPQGKKRR